MDDYITDAQLAEALEAFEATPVPFIPTCFISSGFCPSSPLVSTAFYTVNSTGSDFARWYRGKTVQASWHRRLQDQPQSESNHHD